MNVVHRSRLGAELRFEREYSLFPLGVEHILNEQERLKASMTRFDR